MNTRPGRRTRVSRGAVLIELALILPLLIGLVLICVDFGRFATVHIAVTNAAREGANFGGMHRSTNATQSRWNQGIVDALTEEMIGIPGYSAEQLSIAEPVILASQSRSRVRVEVTYKFRTAIPWPIIPDEWQVSRSAEMPVIR